MQVVGKNVQVPYGTSAGTNLEVKHKKHQSFHVVFKYAHVQIAASAPPKHPTYSLQWIYHNVYYHLSVSHIAE